MQNVTKHHPAVVRFNAQRASDFLTDNDSAESRGDDSVAIKVAQFVREPATDFWSDLCVLKENCALEILAAV